MDKRKRQAIARGVKKVGTDPAVQATKPTPAPESQTATASATVAASKPDSGKNKGGAVIVKPGGETVAMPPLPKMQSAARANTERKAKPERDCACGCGTKTKSEWAPGHDARAKGWALRIQRGILTIDQVPANERAGANLMLTKSAEGTIKLVHSNKPKGEGQATEPAATGTEGK